LSPSCSSGTTQSWGGPTTRGMERRITSASRLERTVWLRVLALRPRIPVAYSPAVPRRTVSAQVRNADRSRRRSIDGAVALLYGRFRHFAGLFSRRGRPDRGHDIFRARSKASRREPPRRGVAVRRGVWLVPQSGGRSRRGNWKGRDAHR